MKQVLIIDDDMSIRESLQPLLESSQVGVITASTLEEAQRMLRAQPFDLVITDLRLTHGDAMEGLDLISEIKKLNPATHVILMTAFGSSDVEQTARRRGASDYWQKSIGIPDIFHRLRLLGIPVGPPES